MTSLLVSAAQQETLMASPSSCAEKVLPPPVPPQPALPLQWSGLRPSFRSGLGSQPVSHRAPTAAASSPGQPLASLSLCCGGDARSASVLIFFLSSPGEVPEKRIQLCGKGLLCGACPWIPLSCKDRDGQVMIFLGETTSPAYNIEDTLSGGHGGTLECGPHRAEQG